jgi:hypothetical protein
VKNAALIIIVVSISAMFATRLPYSLRSTDFPDFYCASRMLLDGHGHELYDADLQRQYQARYAGRVGTLYIHPPFETLLYLVVAWLPLGRAYVLWSALSVAFLAAGAHRLVKNALPQWDWRLLFAGWLGFVPLLLCLLQGQDSVLLLLLVTLAFTDLRRGRGFAAGCWLGLGLFKFPIVLPLLLVLIFTQKRNSMLALAKGFASVALAEAGFSAAISGWAVFRVYPNFLLHLQGQPFAGIFPQAMANFRGLTYIVFRRDESRWAVSCVSLLSVGALIKTLSVWKHADSKHVQLLSSLDSASDTQSEFDLAFASTVLFSLLASYHLNPHDLTLLLLPISVMLHHGLRQRSVKGAAKWIVIGLLGILFFPPLHLLAFKAGLYAAIGIPILVLFLTGGL